MQTIVNISQVYGFALNKGGETNYTLLETEDDVVKTFDDRNSVRIYISKQLEYVFHKKKGKVNNYGKNESNGC